MLLPTDIKPINDTSFVTQRLLYWLSMASLEMQHFMHDDNIRPESQKTYTRRHEKLVSLLRDIKTDIRDPEGGRLVSKDLTSERALDLQLLVTYSLQFNNIGEIYDKIVAMYKEAEANGNLTTADTDTDIDTTELPAEWDKCGDGNIVIPAELDDLYMYALGKVESGTSLGRNPQLTAADIVRKAELFFHKD